WVVTMKVRKQCHEPIQSPAVPWKLFIPKLRLSQALCSCFVVLQILLQGAQGQEASLEVLHKFNSVAGGETPTANVVQSSDGSFYGTTYGGGAHRQGTIFK